MTNLKFKVQGQIIQKMDDNDVVEKSRNEYNAVFEFSDDWIDIENKQAYFTRYKDGFCVKADIDENGICKVPWEVTELPMFYVSVAGGDLKTVTMASVFVKETGYSEEADKSGTVPEVIRTPQSLMLEDNMISMLDKNGLPVGAGVKIKEEWELIDELIVETNEEPVASWFIDLIGRGYKRLWITGEFYSSDTTTATQTISIGGGSASGKYGGTYVQINGTNFIGGSKYYLSAFLTVMPNNNIVGEISIGTNASINSNGGYIKNCGNFVGNKFSEIPRPMIKFGSASQQFAGGTNLQMWGCK